VRRTRKLLEGAFMELVHEKGFQAVSVQDVAERAEINRATFYAHFPDKYALLDHVIQQGFRQELERRMLKTCGFSNENLRALIVAVLEFVARANAQSHLPQPQFESLVETQIKNDVCVLLQHWLEQEGNCADPATSSTAASWAIYGLALQWSREKKRLPAEEYAGKILGLIAANLRLEPRRPSA
jgi:AcrR family transcriptional regulator